jgi:hypothetical protein
LPLARLRATFWNHAETHAPQHPDGIPDTGADVSVLPDTDGTTIDFFQSPYLTDMAGGVVGGSITTLIYRGKVEIDGCRHSVLIQPIPAGQERIFGRDLLNHQRLLFDGPGGKLSWTRETWRTEDHAGVQGLGGVGAARVDQGTQVREQACRVRCAWRGCKMV